MSSSGSSRDASGMGMQMAREHLVLGCTEDQRVWKPTCPGFKMGMGIPALCQDRQPSPSCSLW